MKVSVLVPKSFAIDVREAIEDYKRFINRSYRQGQRLIERRQQNDERRKELIEFMYIHDLSSAEMDKSQLTEIEVEL